MQSLKHYLQQTLSALSLHDRDFTHQLSILLFDAVQGTLQLSEFTFSVSSRIYKGT